MLDKKIAYSALLIGWILTIIFLTDLLVNKELITDEKFEHIIYFLIVASILIYHKFTPMPFEEAWKEYWEDRKLKKEMKENKEKLKDNKPTDYSDYKKKIEK